MTCPITTNTWKELSSRPIRGAEMDPMKVPSTVLYKMLKNMLSEFKTKFKDQFPILKGCDDYAERLSGIRLDSSKIFQTTLLTADFGDAYTETSIEHVQNSVSNIGLILKTCDEKISLVKILIKLVFSNCYFFTPYGLYRQSRGMPMGDVSSRDALDTDLVYSEYHIMSKLSSLVSNVHLYCRLVDDISVVLQGGFSGVRDLLALMALEYPRMPLNCQISFGYSRFLDLHIYNICKSNTNKYKLVHSLAYKEHSTFAYTSRYSNIHDNYKHAVVPISLHRAHTRCTDNADINHHLNFMSRMLRTRCQDPEKVKSKTLSFFRKKHAKEATKKKNSITRKKTTPVLFDRASRRQVFMRKLFKRSFGARLLVVPISKSNLGSILCPKRRIINKLKKTLEKI